MVVKASRETSFPWTGWDLVVMVVWMFELSTVSIEFIFFLLHLKQWFLCLPLKKKEWHCKKKNVKEKTQHLVVFQCASGVQSKTGEKINKTSSHSSLLLSEHWLNKNWKIYYLDVIWHAAIGVSQGLIAWHDCT